MGNCLATVDMGRKDGELLYFFRGMELGPHLRHCGMGEATSVPSGIFIHKAIWSQQIWAVNWGLYPFFGNWFAI